MAQEFSFSISCDKDPNKIIFYSKVFIVKSEKVAIEVMKHFFNTIHFCPMCGSSLEERVVEVTKEGGLVPAFRIRHY